MRGAKKRSMANAYAYARFSTKVQDKGTSLDRQLELIHGYVRANATP